MTCIPGDVVHVDGVYLVVVDVTDGDPPMAVLRRPDDTDLLDPVVGIADALDAVGHLDPVIPGWVEDAPGVWRRA